MLSIATMTLVATMLFGCASAADSTSEHELSSPNGASSNAEAPTTKPAAQIIYDVAAVDNSSTEAIRSCNREPGSGVLLSFDDQGTPEQVMDILTELRNYNAQAAFFPTGDWVLEHLELVEKIKAEGHIVGNHTQTHARLGELSANDPDAFYAETYPLEGITNTDPMWLRPPYEDGAYDPLVQERLTEKGVQLCTWTADTYDWQGASVDEMMQRLTVGDEFSPNPLAADGVVLLHMNTAHANQMIGEIVRYLDSQEIKVAPLGE